MMVMVTVMQIVAMMRMIWEQSPFTANDDADDMGGGADTMATSATPPPHLFCEARWTTVSTSPLSLTRIRLPPLAGVAAVREGGWAYTERW